MVDQTPRPQGRPIRTLLPMACDGVGPSFTCLHLMNGAHLAGQDVRVFANRRRVPRPPVPMTLALPGPLSHLPYRKVARRASRRLERRFVDSLSEGDIAYLWPSVSLATHRVLHARGIPVVLEGINTRMASAKPILDAAYDAFGIPPAHGITQRVIDEEEEKFACADAIFAPNREVELALAGSPLENRFIRASYGVDVTRASPPRDYGARPGEGLTFMFCGFACVRKGVHHLLEAWRHVPAPHKLQFVGRIEPAIAERYRDLLDSDRVETVGFVDDVHPWFARADVFLMPSLEEGGPQVTYEAAAHGLPIIASPMGASRMGDTPGTMRIVDSADTRALAAAMVELAGSEDARAEIGTAAHALVRRFHWPDVGARRAEALQARLAVAAVGV